MQLIKGCQQLSLRPFRTRPACRRVYFGASSPAIRSWPTETAALDVYKAATAEGLEPCLKLLQQAATQKNVKPELVEGALAYLEQNSAQPAADMKGTWRLVFSTATSARFLQYIPVQEDFVVQLDSKKCSLESIVRPFAFKIKGQISGWDPATGALDFQFTAVDIVLLGKQIWQVTSKTKPKRYTFYYQDQQITAARSSAGGLSLLKI